MAFSACIAIAHANGGTGTTQVHLTAALSLDHELRVQGEAGHFYASDGTAYNRYGADYPNGYLDWGQPARAYARCGSFLTMLLEATSGWTPKMAGFTSASPSAAMYYDAIQSNYYGLQHVTTFSTIAPGDLLVSKYLDNTGDSGHVMIVNSAKAGAPDSAGTVKWQVEVVDCSSSNHSNDTRVFTSGGMTFSTGGVGRGSIYVYTRNNQVTGWTWSLTSAAYTPAGRPLTLGRLALKAY